MANVMIELVAALCDDPEVIRLVPASRIEPYKATQKTTRPNIVLTNEHSEPTWGAFGGDDGMARPIVEIFCYADKAIDAHAVADAVKAKLKRFAGTPVKDEILDITLEDEGGDWNEDERVFYRFLEFLVTHRED